MKSDLNKIDNLQNTYKKKIFLDMEPNASIEGVAPFETFKNLVFEWNAWRLYVSYLNAFVKVKTFFMKNKEAESEAEFKVKSKWIDEMEKINNDISEKFDAILPSSKGVSRPVSMNDAFIKEFQEQILTLEVIDFQENLKVPSTLELSGIEELVNGIKNEVKKGNRVSFKLLQELQETMEGASSNAPEEINGAVHQTIEEYEEKMNGFINMAIKAVDSIDLIYQSAFKADLKEWTEQIQQVLHNFLQILDSFGIEELNVKDTFFDGETMISIGTVPPEYAPGLEKYQVYSVHEKGFRFKESGKLIREAKVITIY